MASDVDVCVVGGGPAGSSTALRLAQLGQRVCLVERACFPRPHVGESLPPTILPLLAELGLRDAVERAGFLRAGPARLQWASLPPGQFDGKGGQQGFDPLPGFQVDRGRFDQLLLDGARAAGVTVLAPAQPGRAIADRCGGWRMGVSCDGELIEIRARFLVDAAGRRGFLKQPRAAIAPTTLALFGYWRDVPLDGSETLIEDGPAEWFWGAPLPGGVFNATVFVDPQRYRCCVSGGGLRSVSSGGLRGVSGGGLCTVSGGGLCTVSGDGLRGVSGGGLRKGRQDAATLYRSLLAGSNLLRGCLRGRLIDQPRICDATCYASTVSVAANWIKVGESSFSIDPLSSQGVQTAIASGLTAAAVVNTLLVRPQNAPLAIAFYRDNQRAAVERHAHHAAEIYRRQAAVRSSPFWQSRARCERPAGAVPIKHAPLHPQMAVCLAPDTHVIETGVLRNGFIEAHPALMCDSWDRPVAFVADFPIALLAAALRDARPAHEFVAMWSRRQPADVVWQLLAWLWHHEAILEHTGWLQ
ncbi:MAG TPA: FAD-dependent oxidoreductase [Pirellulales bacterium]|jgi:flavin-dependent dehydrogenase|nr:FAD-dependent oxidoreductase [Pirellulales bacterium]